MNIDKLQAHTRARECVVGPSCSLELLWDYQILAKERDPRARIPWRSVLSFDQIDNVIPAEFSALQDVLLRALELA